MSLIIVLLMPVLHCPLWVCMPQSSLVRNCSSACTSVCFCVFLLYHQKAKNRWVVDPHWVFLQELNWPKGDGVSLISAARCKGDREHMSILLPLTLTLNLFHLGLYPTPTTFLSSHFCISCLSLFNYASPSNSFKHGFLLSESLSHLSISLCTLNLSTFFLCLPPPSADHTLDLLWWHMWFIQWKTQCTLPACYFITEKNEGWSNRKRQFAFFVLIIQPNFF